MFGRHHVVLGSAQPSLPIAAPWDALAAAIVLSCVAVLLGALVLHALPRLGGLGRRVGDRLARAPMLDLVLAYLLAMPPIVGLAAGGWAALVGAIAGQIVAALVWMRLHEFAHRGALRGPRLVKSLNATLGRARNHAALWWMTIAVPVFLVVRLSQYLVYPVLVRLIGLPRYDASEWVAVSRQKFDGLVGHDLIWCLYCDWMTGVWSLGSEMLRNIESLYCPIRFVDSARCANCSLDFPDINEWAPADGDMRDVVALVEEKYPPGRPSNPWFGHPVRLTVDGSPASSPPQDPRASG